MACHTRMQAICERTLCVNKSALVQKVRHNVERQPQARIVRRTLKDLDKRHQRHGQRGCVKVPSHDLSLVSATEGTERGRRGGVPSGMGGSERAPEPLYVGARSYWVCNTSFNPLTTGPHSDRISVACPLSSVRS